MKTDQAHFESLIRNAADMIIALDAQGLIRYASPSVERVLGFKPRGAIGKSFFAWIHPDDLPKAQEAFASRRVKPGAAPAPIQVRGRHKDGSWRVIEALGTNLLDDPDVGALILNARDVTERVEGEKRLSIQHAVTLALSEANTLAEAMPKILQAVCEGLDWKRGECWSAHWSMDKETMRLQCIESCQVSQGESPQFETITSEIKFEPGEGLPGRVFASGKPEWTPDIARDGFARAAQALKAGYRAAFAFPVKVGSETLGVMTFLDGKIRPPDAGQSQIMESIGHQIGQFVERKQAEEARRESEERYRLLFENSLDAILLTVPDGAILAANPAACAMFGLTEAEICALGRAGLVDITDPQLPLLLAERERTGKAQGELRMLRKGSAPFPTEISSAMYQDAQGNVQTTIVIRDITERKRAEESLRQSEERFSSAFNSSPAGIAITVEDGRILDVNPTLLQSLGYERDEVVGKHPHDINLWGSPAEREKINAALERDGRVSNLEIQVHAKSGALRDMLLSSEPVTLGSEACLLTIFHDVTDVRRAEQEARLLQTIALGVSGVKGLDETIQNILQLICESTGWTMGEAWIPSTDGTRLERHPAWFSREPGLEEFREASAEFTFEPGVGLPGRAWQSHRAVWVEDVTQDPNFPRAELARQAGLKTGMGVPVLGTEEARQAGLRAGVSIPVIANGQVTLVLDFFLREARLQDPRLIELISAVAAELGVVVERKRAQEEMRKAEEKYRALVEESPNVLYLDKADEDSACVYISPQVETLLGYLPADFENEPLLWHKIIDPRDYEIAARSIRTTLERGKADLEYRMIARDGRAKWVHDMSVLVKDAGGNPQFLQGFLEDITARKEAEEALRKSEKRYRHLFETNLAGVYRSHMDGRLLTCNDAFARIYGYESSAEMMLHSTRELYRTADDHENFFALLRERTSLIGYESEGRRRDGTSIWLLENTALVPDEAGEMKEIEGTLVDITARKEAEEALCEAERFARSTLDALTSNISVLDESGTIIAVNRAWREFAEANGGDSQSTGVGVNYLEVCDSAGGKDSLFGADMAACIRSVLREEQDTYEIEYPCHSPDEQRWFVARISRFEADGPMRVVVSHGDITKRKLAETSLRSRVIELEAISKIAAALRAAQTLEEILPLLLGETLAALDSEAGSISLYRAESGELYKAAAQGWLSNLPYMLIKPGAGIMGTVFSSGKLHVSREFASDPLLLPASSASVPPGWGGVCVPLRAANEVVGVVFVAAPLPREFSPEEIKLLVSISEIAGTAIHRLRLHEEILHRFRQLQTLQKIDRAITSTPDLQVVFSILLSQAREALGVDAACVLLIDQSTHHLRCRAAQGFKSRAIEKTDLLLNEGYAGRAASERQIIHIQNLDQTGEAFSRARLLAGEEFVSYVATPLVARGQVQGVLEIFHRAPFAPGEDWFYFLKMLAEQAAIAVDNAQLFTSAQREIGERRQAQEKLRALNVELEKRIEERTADLRQLNNELESALRIKDEFLANMSHELRTPLNAIIGLSESLAEQTVGALNERQAKYIGTISESGQHLLSLINDILDLAKIEAGQMTLNREKVDVSMVCQSSLRMIKQLALKKRLDVRFEMDVDPGMIWADERRLKQMIVNLLSNAVKFTPEGGSLGLQARGDRENNSIQFAVWDTGIGIAEEDLPRLFQPFVQLDSQLARKAGGTGLGLALVAKTAALHGGSASVESQLGRGSRFTITLPWESAHNTGPLEERVPLDSQTSAEAPKRHTILLVDDTEDVILLFKDYLERAGYRVVAGRNGVEAVALAEQVNPSLILMDVQMPVMDGMEAARNIRRIPALRHTPIIALTALAMKGDRDRCLEAGMSDYLSKPVTLKELTRMIQSHLDPGGMDSLR